MAGTLRMVLGDQLSDTLSALADCEAGDVVLMVEVVDECTYVRHHKKKIVLVLSGMRHFAERLRGRGITVDYVRLDDAGNSQTLQGELLRAVARHRPERVVLTEPGEWRLLVRMRRWHELTGLETEIRNDDRFLCSTQAFGHWASRRKSLRMEFFYRDMRRRYDILMDGQEPEGGRWNFDPENRKPLPKRVQPPPLVLFEPDATTREVMALVEERFAGHFGSAAGFSLPVTAEQAEQALAAFIAGRLALFGDWQDAMRTGSPVLFHALVSTSMNCGLLDPRHVVAEAEAAYRRGAAPLNAVEGFIRQIIGWREYVRGVYWMGMPGYGQRNGLEARRRMPWLYWSGETRMNCMAQAIGDTREHAYAHHIQRLMITGNFALLAGLDPNDVDEWYMIVYADAYEWVEMPNVRGMALHADGGVMGSKPYAASGAYINRMSDYCGRCTYNVKDATGPDACPFNFLYWDFMARHQARFATNPRMAFPNRTLERMAPARLAAIRDNAARFLDAMDAGEGV